MTRADDIGLEWDSPLKFRWGSPTRLDGIEIYYDFDWYALFPDWRAQFKHGQCLARLVRADCPEGKTPALLLTTRGKDHERPIHTASHFVVVVDLPTYQAQADVDAAKSYYAGRAGKGITELGQLPQAAPPPDSVRSAVEYQVRLEDIAEWAVDNEEHIEQLRGIAGVRESSRPSADLAQIIGAVESLADLEPDIVRAIEGLLERANDREARLRFLEVLTGDRSGRLVTSEVIGQRVVDRLSDARAVTQEYSSLLAAQAGESELQRFIEENPWLLGLDYVRVRPRHLVPRGQLDFILERYDGFHDLLELKSPQDPIITAPDLADGMPPPASAFSLSPDLAKALAQVHVYRDVLSTDEQTMSAQYGLRNTRHSRVIIVIGQLASLPSHRERALRELNRSLHRVEVAPYDLLASRANTVLDNVERHLAVAQSETEVDQDES